MSFDLPAFIAANLPLASPSNVPEVRLHLATSTSGLRRLAERDADFRTPYWAYAWAGGLVLARHILDHPEIVKGRRVLDLGAGSGLVAIAAAKAGAASVLAAETDPYGLAALRLNAEANGATVEATGEDLLPGPPPPVDLILAGDLFYAEDVAARALAFLQQAATARITVLIGDPGRAFLPRERLELVAEHPVPDVGGGGSGVSGVFALTL